MSALICRLREICRGDRREAGVTITELIVTMMVLSVIMVMVMAFFTGASKAFKQNQGDNASTRSASNGMNEMTRMLRASTNNLLSNGSTASAFVSATPTSVTFYAYVNLDNSLEQPIEVRFALNTTTGALVESKWAATSQAGGLWTFPDPSTVPSSTRTIATSVIPSTSGGPALFSYRDKDGNTIAYTGSAVSPTNSAFIASVQVQLMVGTSSATNQSVSLTNIVGLPNLAIARTS